MDVREAPVTYAKLQLTPRRELEEGPGETGSMSTSLDRRCCGSSPRGSRRGSWELGVAGHPTDQLLTAIKRPTAFACGTYLFRLSRKRSRGLKICKHSPRVNVGAIFGRGRGPIACLVPRTIVPFCMTSCDAV